jgi:GH18 family chitinase
MECGHPGDFAITQSVAGVTVSSLGDNAIMDQDFNKSNYLWDSTAHAPYLSITAPAPSQNKFIGYDDPKLAVEKVEYAREQHLGGITLFEIGGAYRPNQPKGQMEELLQAVKQVWKGSLPKVLLPVGGQ